MKETLELRNFGPISQIKIDLLDVTIIIGKQGTGKSTVAKVLNILKEESFYANDSKGKMSFFEKDYLINYFKKDTYIRFTSQNFSLTYSNGKFAFYPKDILKRHINEYKRIHNKRDITKSETTHRNELLKSISAQLGVAAYIPTERTIVPTLSSLAISLFDRKVPLPQYLLNFGTLFSLSQYRRIEVDFEFLNLVYKTDKGESFIYVNNQKAEYLELSSGYQSLIPLIATIEYLTISDSVHGILIVEELEANLFPETQYQLLQYVTNKCLKLKDKVLLTTHSPYVLSALNILMLAFMAGQKNDNKISKIVNKKYWIDPKSVSAYMFNSDGSFEDIIDAKTKQIKAEKIDSVSEMLNSQYEEIMNIAYP